MHSNIFYTFSLSKVQKTMPSIWFQSYEHEKILNLCMYYIYLLDLLFVLRMICSYFLFTIYFRYDTRSNLFLYYELYTHWRSRMSLVLFRLETFSFSLIHGCWDEMYALSIKRNTKWIIWNSIELFLWY